MIPDEIVIRPLAPDEIDVAVSIDDDACSLYEQAGLHVDLDPDHPFARAERTRWTEAAQAGTAFLAEQPGMGTVGLLVLRVIDGAPYLEQLSVRSAVMRQGIGRLLVNRAIAWAAHRPLWLTTYAHLPWNRPIYEGMGFVAVPEGACSPGIIELLTEQRRWLPAPAQRIAMRRVP